MTWHPLIDPPWRKKPLQHPTQITMETWDGEELIGISNGMTDSEVTYLTDLYVKPGYRGKGFGKDLLTRFLDATKGTTIIVLTAEAGFYEKLGFKKRECLVRMPE